MGKLNLVNKVGLLGEDIACRYLENHGYLIVERNWRENWGEIDIIAKKDKELHFFEVKSLSVIGVEENRGGYRPEENVHPKKLERLSRVVQTYLNGVNYEGGWSFSVIVVLIDEQSKKAKVTLIEEVLS